MRQFEVYQHYKGGLYLKLCEARHSGTDEILVTYVCAVSGEVWARPKDMFDGTVVHEGKPVPRFWPVPYTDNKDIRKRAAILDGDGHFLGNGGGHGAG